MLVPIEINSQDIVDQFTSVTHGDLETMFDNIAKGLALSYLGQLEAMVSQELKTTRRRYLQSLRLVDEGRMVGTVMLDFSQDSLIQMIERGGSAFDMKEGILRSSKVKVTKAGNKYLTIPFRWATPSALGESDLFTGRMPNSVYKVAKKLDSATPSGNSSGIQDSMLTPKRQTLGVRKEVTDGAGKVYAEYSHKSSIYQGIRKETDSATGQSTYNSFRRVSELSDPNSFIHPGIKERNFMNRTFENMSLDSEVSSLLDLELEKLGLI